MSAMTEPRSSPRILRLLRFAFRVAIGLLALWSLGAILFGGVGPGSIGPVRWGLGLAFVAAVTVVVRRPGGALGLALAGLFCTAVAGWWFRIEPSHDRTWQPDQVRLPRAEVDGTRVTIRDVRDFRWTSATEARERWYDATYDLDELEGVDFFQTHFSGLKAVGHTMIGFRFAGDRFVTFSVEARKELGEAYGMMTGLYRGLELMYVVADERDIVQVRTNQRGEEVYLHPIRRQPEKERALFLDLCRRLNEIRIEPAFYNTLASNCTTNLIRHFEIVTGTKFPLDRRWVLAGRADDFAFERGAIDTDVDFDETRRRNYINDRAVACGGREDFSLCIRQRP